MKNTVIILIIITFTSFVCAQSVEIKDSADETLMIVNDEGEGKSSITIPVSETAPDQTDYKLYNEAGTLKWNGSQLGTSNANGHSLNAADGNPIDAVYVDNDGKVGIGTSSPSGTVDIRVCFYALLKLSKQ